MEILPRQNSGRGPETPLRGESPRGVAMGSGRAQSCLPDISGRLELSMRDLTCATHPEASATDAFMHVRTPTTLTAPTSVSGARKDDP